MEVLDGKVVGGVSEGECALGLLGVVGGVVEVRLMEICVGMGEEGPQVKRCCMDVGVSFWSFDSVMGVVIWLRENQSLVDE